MIVRTLEHASFEEPGSIAAWVERACGRLERTLLWRGDTLPDLDGLNLLVLMGGPMSVNDTLSYPWLVGEIGLVRDAMDRGVPVLGVCLGAQIVARALGARVYPAAEREIGWHRVAGLPAAGSLAPPETPLFHWHGETFDLPPGAGLLASTPACPNQAFAVGKAVLGVQCHPEMTAQGARALVAACPSDLAPGRWVQDAATILNAPPAWYDAGNRLSDAMLDHLTLDRPMEVSGGVAGAEAQDETRRSGGHGQRAGEARQKAW